MSDTEQQKSEAAAAEEVEQVDLGALARLTEAARISPQNEARPAAEGAIEVLVNEIVAKNRTSEPVDKTLINSLIADIDERLSAQLDEILHQPEFQQLESAWRGLRYVVDNTDFTQNIEIEVMNATKEDLLEDFQDNPADRTLSGFYQTAYTEEYGVFGGKPYGAIIGNYDFGPETRDILLLEHMAAVAAMAHAPFIAAAGARFFNLEDVQDLSKAPPLDEHFSSDQFIKWHSFRETEDARYVGLTMPRFLLRLPYGKDNPVKTFDYSENVEASHEDYMWGNTAFAMAARMTDSFARYRWCPNIVGPRAGGSVENLHLHQFEAMGELDTKIPTEVIIPERMDQTLSDQGFIPLVYRKGSDNAAFFSANSCQKPKEFFGDDAEAATFNYKLATQLPYMMIINRIAHYIKQIQRENIGGEATRVDVENEMNEWLRGFIADQDNPKADIIREKPLRKAKVVVEDVADDPGWFRVRLEIQPHIKLQGMYVTLSLNGKLDKWDS